MKMSAQNSVEKKCVSFILKDMTSLTKKYI